MEGNKGSISGMYCANSRVPFQNKVISNSILNSKALFKRSLERNGKNKNVTKIDIEKMLGIFFLEKK